MSASDFLILSHVSKVYRRNQSLLERLKKNEAGGTKAVSDVSLTVRHGETMGLVGESGCGKSTLARLVSGLMAPTSGEISFPPSASGNKPRLQMIFQDPYSSLNGRWTIEDIIAEPIRVHKLRQGRAAIRARVDELLVQVGLSAADAEKYPQEFSGGQRQRICIARALAGEPEFLILDEPTSALDVSVQAQILNLLRDLQKNLHLTSLFITHNLSVVRIMADRIGVMYLGEPGRGGDFGRTVPQAPPSLYAPADRCRTGHGYQRPVAASDRRRTAEPGLSALRLPFSHPLSLRAGDLPQYRTAAEGDRDRRHVPLSFRSRPLGQFGPAAGRRGQDR